jgi:hypothetical protein
VIKNGIEDLDTPSTVAVDLLLQSKWRVQNSMCYAIWSSTPGSAREAYSWRLQENADPNLRQLEADGIVVRRDMSELVLHIEYELDERTREGVRGLIFS